MQNNEYDTPLLKQRIWFFLTCLRPSTKYEICNLQAQLIIILEGLRGSDLQHFQIERMLENEIKKLKENNGLIEKKKEEQSDNMFN